MKIKVGDEPEVSDFVLCCCYKKFKTYLLAPLIFYILLLE